MFWIVHYMGWQGVERNDVGDFGLFLSLHFLDFLDHVCVNDFVSGEEVMANLFLSEVELNCEFASLN